MGFPLLASSIPSGEAGAYTALYFSVRSVAGAVALPAAGWAIDLTGSYRALPAAGAAATLLALVPLIELDGRRTRSGARAKDAGLAVAGLSLATVAVTAAGAAIAATPLDDLDRRIFRAIHAYGPGSPLLDRLIIDPTIRNYLILGGIAVAAGAVSPSRRALGSGLAAAAAGVLAFAMVRAAWVLWDRPRPQEALPDVVVTAHDFAPHSSFPSGHVAVTVAMVVAIAALHPRLRAPLWAFVAAMAVTRVLSGAHFPSDVLLAIPLGVAAAAAARRTLAPVPAPAPARRPQESALRVSQ
jgi:membrane-associated phospholipid phosphatase